MENKLAKLIANSRFAYFCIFLTLACIFSILSVWPREYSRAHVLIWVGASVFYPFCLTLARLPTGFWKGLLLLLLLLESAQAIAFAGYIARLHGVQHSDYVAVHIFTSDLIESAVLALVCYSAGALAARLMVKRQMDVEIPV